MSFIENYDYLITIRHVTLGEIEIWKSKENQTLAYCRILDENYPLQLLNARSSWNNEYVLELLAAELHKSQSNNYIKVYFEFYDQSLQTFLYCQQNPLDENFILSILIQIVKGLKFIIDKNETCNLVTTNIFYLDGKIKLVEGNSYLHYKQQLGLVLFELCTRESYFVLIDDKNNISIDYLNEIIPELKYSQYLINLLKDLLDQNKNWNINQIADLIINNYNSFIFNNQIQIQENNNNLSINKKKLTLKYRAQQVIRQYKQLLNRIQ